MLAMWKSTASMLVLSESEDMSFISHVYEGVLINPQPDIRVLPDVVGRNR